MNRYVLTVALLSALPLCAQEVDHSKMDHSKMDHSAMNHGDTPKDSGDKQDQTKPKTPFAIPTDADREAAFPKLATAHAHGSAWIFKAQLDHLEYANANTDWEANASFGSDTQRLLLRSSGEWSDSKLEHSDADVLFARSFSPWWETVVGLNHIRQNDQNRSFLAFGLLGMAPYKFEIEATAYVGEKGQSRLQLAAEYETLLTSRWILEPKLEAEFYGQNAADLGWGAGLGQVEAGLRLRYEITRQFAPYVGLVHTRYFGNTAQYLQAAGKPNADTEWVFGVRAWF